MSKQSDVTFHSKEIPGSVGNYDWTAKFDKVNGYVGINQTSDGVLNRVLLSPRQVRKLLKFLGVRAIS